MMSEIDHEHVSEVVCPYCGVKERDSWELNDTGEIDCDCGKTFYYERSVEVTYSSGKMCHCFDGCSNNHLIDFCLCKICDDRESKKYCGEGKTNCQNKNKEKNEFVSWT